MVDQCFYHPAPMTKPAGTPRKQPEPRRKTVKQRYSETRQGSRDHGSLPPLHLSPTLRNDIGTVGPLTSTSSWPTPPDSATRTTGQSASESGRSFFLGSTSYASVFAEEQPIPESMHEQPPDRVTAPPSLIASRSGGNRHCQMGVGHSIISKLSPFSLFEDLVKMYFDTNKAAALVGPLVLSALPQVRTDLEQLTANSAEIYPLYAEITRNTARPLKVPPTMTATEFHTLFTGKNLRWETLGVILVIAGSNAQFTSPDDPIFTLEDGRKIDKDEFIEDMIHASNDCINLCQVHGAVNDIMIWLLYSNMLVQSNFYGDNYHGVWRGLGACISALYAEGIHCEESFEPFFLRETRRKLFASTYKSDKQLATFFGRPPMMAWKYSNRKMPLDLDDEVVCTSNPDVLDEAISKLDNEGWNTEGKICTASWIRLRFLNCVFKERILEQSLAGEVDDDVVQKTREISINCRRTWESVPAQMRYDLYDEDRVWTELDPSVTLRMISAYLEYLHIEFQVQRIIRRHTQTAVPALLELSMKLLSTVLIFNKHRKPGYGIQRHVPTIILFHCFPSAGVLALELRRCTLENVPLPGTVSRADIIRNLSVLISCLEWVILPGDGNHKLCSELNKMLAMVLDQVLNHQPPPTSADSEDSSGGIGDAGGGFFDMPMIDGMEPIPTQSEDFLNWLDNANWNNTYLF